jgi:hypothetical protein
MLKSKYHPNFELPKAGAKIEYAVKFNDVNVAVYGDLSEMHPGREGVGLSDSTDWGSVRIWKYIDEDYNYGKKPRSDVQC